jgi:broad specificity phosphatase PhoE
MPPRKLMLIRHGEKEPDKGGPPFGVNADGEQDKHSLSPRGWQRAGALVPFFRKAWAPGVETPDAIYASRVGAKPLITKGRDVSKSLRPQQTVTPLADALNLSEGLQTPYAVGEESQLAQSIYDTEDGVVLVAWEHNHIPLIAQAFRANVPDSWPDGRFDDVWILTASDDGTYAFEQVPQSLLSGDQAASS